MAMEKKKPEPKKMISDTCIVIAGPTASGKTAAAIQTALHFNTSILSADSRQCYKEMNIGVARPSEEELREAPHYFIASHSIHEEINAAAYEKFAIHTAAEIFKTNPVLVVTGGTGLYLKAFLEGMDDIPEVPADIQAEVRSRYEASGLSELLEWLKKVDPEYFLHGEISNPHRVMRALEVALSSGKSIREFQRNQRKKRDFKVKKFALEWPREILYERINARVDAMMQAGLLEEARSLLPFKYLPALNTVGYSELFSYFGGEITLGEAVERIKQNTRRYAKRQLTWFRKDPEMTWISPDAISSIPDFI